MDSPRIFSEGRRIAQLRIGCCIESQAHCFATLTLLASLEKPMSLRVVIRDGARTWSLLAAGAGQGDLGRERAAVDAQSQNAASGSRRGPRAYHGGPTTSMHGDLEVATFCSEAQRCFSVCVYVCLILLWVSRKGTSISCSKGIRFGSVAAPCARANRHSVPLAHASVGRS